MDRVKEWSTVISLYKTLTSENFEIEPLSNLVKEISSSNYATMLFPMTSHEILYLAQSAQALHNIPRLKINYNPKKQEFIFTYENSHTRNQWWTRTAKQHEGFQVLERFLLKRARWFRALN